jgi:hypothetical protein
MFFFVPKRIEHKKPKGILKSTGSIGSFASNRQASEGSETSQQTQKKALTFGENEILEKYDI